MYIISLKYLWWTRSKLTCYMHSINVWNILKFSLYFPCAQALFSHAKPCILFQIRTKPANTCHSTRLLRFQELPIIVHGMPGKMHSTFVRIEFGRQQSSRMNPKSVCIHWARIPGRLIASFARYAVRVSVSYWNCSHCKLVMHIERMRTYAAHQCP